MLIRVCGIFLILLWLLPGRVAGDSHLPPPQLLVEYRIAELDISTPVALDYNEHVQEFITLFSGERREVISRVLGLKLLYFPIIDEIFDKYGLPFEIKYISIVESALNPVAVSPSGAMGLWQFLVHTARMFNLEINSYIDERRDVYKSTDAAARYMSYLYEMFGDWHLVFAAYNSGPGVVRNAIERSGGSSDYWEIRKYLPEQSKRFIPAFIAVNYLVNYYEDYGIEPIPPSFTFTDIDTLHISRPLNLKQVSGELNIQLETLRFLNPVYIRDHIPANGISKTLVLPSEYVAPFLNSSERIFTHGIRVNTGAQVKDQDSRQVRVTHRVRKGEFIHRIAMMYGTIGYNIMEWNDLDDDLIFEGQELIIWVSPDNLQFQNPGSPFPIDNQGSAGQ